MNVEELSRLLGDLDHRDYDNYEKLCEISNGMSMESQLLFELIKNLTKKLDDHVGSLGAHEDDDY
jgi:hypothetical protein